MAVSSNLFKVKLLNQPLQHEPSPLDLSGLLDGDKLSSLNLSGLLADATFDTFLSNLQTVE